MLGNCASAGLRTGGRQVGRTLVADNTTLQTTQHCNIAQAPQQATQHSSSTLQPLKSGAVFTNSSRTFVTDNIALQMLQGGSVSATALCQPAQPHWILHPLIKMSTTPSSYPVLDKLGFLQKKNMRIKDPAGVERILQTFITGGLDKLQLVVDYDYTLTRTRDDEGNKCHSSWGVLDNSTLMPEFYRKEALQLLQKYYPMEICTTMTEEEKIPHMVSWYDQMHALVVRCELSRADVHEMVVNSRSQLRTGSDVLLGLLEKAGVPVLVFSAGMGDILLEVLQQAGLHSPNVRVVSNFFKYDQQERVVGFDGDMIHMFNKNENAIHSSNYFGEVSGRCNVLLMGDSLGDIKMSVGVPTPNTILKIGFLNDKVEERLGLYEAAYDIVLLDDQTMDAANAVVTLLAPHSLTPGAQA